MRYALARDLILTYTNPGDLVLDPMRGGSATPAAAKRLDRRAVGRADEPVVSRPRAGFPRRLHIGLAAENLRRDVSLEPDERPALVLGCVAARHESAGQSRLAQPVSGQHRAADRERADRARDERPRGDRAAYNNGLP